jgi:hydroxymethylpyrimidine pyrophosphatase-like HAD family hydrolase
MEEKHLHINKQFAEFLKLKNFVNPNGTKTYSLWEALIPYVGLDRWTGEHVIEYTDECHENYLQFHRDWTWLMKVLLTVESLKDPNKVWGVSTFTLNNSFAIYARGLQDGSVHYEWNTLIEEDDVKNGNKMTQIYHGLSRFIDWYNKQGKKKL